MKIGVSMNLTIVLSAMILMSPLSSSADEPRDDQTDAGVAAAGLCKDCLTPIVDRGINENRAGARRIVDWIVDPNASGAPPALDSEATR